MTYYICRMGRHHVEWFTRSNDWTPLMSMGRRFTHFGNASATANQISTETGGPIHVLGHISEFTDGEETT